MDIVVTTVQSLSKGKYSQQLLDEFGFVVADEIHLMAAQVFHLAFTFVRSKYRLGLTATPDRKDGLQQVIQWFFSVPAVTLRQPRKDVGVRILHYTAGDQTPLWIGRPANRKPNFVKMITRLTEDAWRNKLSCKEIIEQAAKTQGQTLVVTERKAHVTKLTSMLAEANPMRDATFAQHNALLWEAYRTKKSPLSKFPIQIIMSISKHLGSLSVAAMTGDHSEAERRIAKSADIITATLLLAKESIDLPNLTRLFIATPVSKNIIQQLRGRILRMTEQETKRRNLDLMLLHLFDDWDEPGIISGMFWGCHKFYKAEEYKIHHFTYDADILDSLFPVE